MTTTSDNIAAIEKYVEMRLSAHLSECDDPLWPVPHDVQIMRDAKSALLAEARKAEAMEREIAEKDARIAALEAALMPFASHKTADGLPNGLLRIPDGHPVLFNGLGNDVRVVATIGDIRRARTLLNGGSDAQG